MKNMILNRMLLFLVGFNEAGAKNYIKSYTDPIMSTLLWVIPVTGAISVLITAVMYNLKDEEDRDRHKFSKQLKKIITVCIIAESITIIFNIVGIATS